MASTIIPPLLEKQLAKIYANFCTENSTLNITHQSIHAATKKGDWTEEHLLLPLDTIGHNETICRIQ